MAENIITPLARELQYLRGVSDTFVPFVERDNPLQYPAKYPLSTDWIYTDWHQPTQNLRPSHAQESQETMQSGFRRTTLEAKLSWGAAPFKNDSEFNIAAANGHPNGMVGRNNNYLPEDLNPEYGGGYRMQ